MYSPQREAMKNEYWTSDISPDFKKCLYELIQYYYFLTPDNGCGGIYHVVLDDGNIEHDNIRGYIDECEACGDSLGFLIGHMLLEYTEDELWDMFEKDFWGMQN